MTVDYKIRSIRLVDLIGQLKARNLILSSYFQRNLVWRLPHKRDFIKTILLGYPFPEVFIAKGELDVQNMTSRDCIVDGQQRVNSIEEYLDDKFDVENKKFSDLNQKDKENFLKYEIAIVDLDLKHDDPEVIEIFQRLNRVFYTLNTIEKYSTVYAHAEIVLVAKLISGELYKKLNNNQDDSEEELQYDPRISQEFLEWGKGVKCDGIQKLLSNTDIFTEYEISRQSHLLYALNILTTIQLGIINRNVTRSMLDDYVEEYPDKEVVIKQLNLVANKINGMRLSKKSYWNNKTNIFSLIYVIYSNYDKIKDINAKTIKETLERFEKNLPKEYLDASREGVNNRNERITRDNYLKQLIDSI